jgi:hypothetical protein
LFRSVSPHFVVIFITTSNTDLLIQHPPCRPHADFSHALDLHDLSKGTLQSMEETCIVCLGDLATGEPQSRRSSLVDPHREGGPDAVCLAGLDHHVANSNTKHIHCKCEDVTHTTLDPSEAIAHLLPCGHELHNACLRPWVERCSSCPICRSNINMVELKAVINGEAPVSHFEVYC